MRKIPEKLRKEMAGDLFYEKCARCFTRNNITWEHAIIYAGKQLNKKWAIIPLCSYCHSVNEHQDGGNLDKEVNKWISLNRATDAELEEISKAIDYKAERDRLNKIYGTYHPHR